MALLPTDDLPGAERHLLLTLSVNAGRASPWANLGLAYAKQGKAPEAVAALANACRFSTHPPNTQKYLRDLADQDPDARVKEAAAQALRLRFLCSAA